MLSEEEKRDMLEMAASPALRAQFEELTKASLAADRRGDLDAAVSWLTFMSRAFNWKSSQEPPIGNRFLI